MTFGKRPSPPTPEEQAALDACPHCRGAGSIRARGQRKVCVPCKGTGKKPDALTGPRRSAALEKAAWNPPAASGAGPSARIQHKHRAFCIRASSCL